MNILRPIQLLPPTQMQEQELDLLSILKILKSRMAYRRQWLSDLGH